MIMEQPFLVLDDTPQIDIYSLIINSSNHLFAGSIEGIFRSTDSGASWLAINRGIENRDVF